MFAVRALPPPQTHTPMLTVREGTPRQNFLQQRPMPKDQKIGFLNLFFSHHLGVSAVLRLRPPTPTGTSAPHSQQTSTVQPLFSLLPSPLLRTMADKYKVAPEPNGDAPAAASDETKGEAKAMGERRPSVAFMNESVTNKGSVEIVEEEWSFEHVKLLYVDGEDDGARENARSAPAPARTGTISLRKRLCVQVCLCMLCMHAQDRMCV